MFRDLQMSDLFGDRKITSFRRERAAEACKMGMGRRRRRGHARGRILGVGGRRGGGKGEASVGEGGRGGVVVVVVVGDGEGEGEGKGGGEGTLGYGGALQALETLCRSALQTAGISHAPFQNSPK